MADEQWVLEYQHQGMEYTDTTEFSTLEAAQRAADDLDVTAERETFPIGITGPNGYTQTYY